MRATPVRALCVGMRSKSRTTGHGDNQSLDYRSGSRTAGTIHLKQTAAGKCGGRNEMREKDGRRGRGEREKVAR